MRHRCKCGCRTAVLRYNTATQISLVAPLPSRRGNAFCLSCGRRRPKATYSEYVLRDDPALVNLAWRRGADPRSFGKCRRCGNRTPDGRCRDGMRVARRGGCTAGFTTKAQGPLVAVKLTFSTEA